MTEIVAFIFARGGSKGLPGKNVRPLGGVPLIGRAINDARAVPRISRVIVSTDCPTIAGVAREFGAEVPFLRPAELARDDTPEWLAWRHALRYVEKSAGRMPDTMVSVPATAPLRQPADIDACLDIFEEGSADIVITVTEANRSPYFNMVQKNADGTVALIIPPIRSISRRQDAPPVYDIATIAYVCASKFVMTHHALFEGQVKCLIVPKERAVDIDSLGDFEWAEWLLLRREGK